MSHRVLYLTKRSARWLVLVWLVALTPTAQADIVYAIDQGKLGGTVGLEQGNAEITLIGAQGEAQNLRLIDIDQIRFNVDLSTPQAGHELLLDNDQGPGTHQKQAKTKLRAGLHRITLPYWQGKGAHKLALYVAGPGINGRVELGSEQLRCFRDTSDTSDTIAGRDEEGFRSPELPLKEAGNRRRMLTRARYRLYTGQEGAQGNGVTAIPGMLLKRSGTTSSINTGMLNEHNQDVGLVFDAFFKAEEDGEYTFTLRSDDGSQLYLGQVENYQSDQIGGPPVNTPWRADLAHDGKAMGELKAINNESMTFHIPLVSDVTLSLSHTRSVWDKKTNPSTVNRENEPSNQDTVYLRDKKDPKLIRSVSGKISSLDEESLRFIFRGEERTIARDRMVGLVFKHDSRPTPPSPGTYQVIEIHGGQELPCHVEAISEHVTVQLLGGGQATPPRDVLRAMRIENGRRIDLTRLSPNAEEAVPYFGLKFEHKVNTNFSGKPITLYNNKTYDRGLAVHSKSRLHYKLKPDCERFQATFGLMAPGGKLGDITARILGDGEVLWEQDGITAATRAIDVDVLLKGVERLILEVDFGQGQDVGDRAAWCNPRLIYSASGQDQP